MDQWDYEGHLVAETRRRQQTFASPRPFCPHHQDSLELMSVAKAGPARDAAIEVLSGGRPSFPPKNHLQDVATAPL